MDSGLLTRWFITIYSSLHLSQGGDTSENRCNRKNLCTRLRPGIVSEGLLRLVKDLLLTYGGVDSSAYALCRGIYRRVCIQSAGIIKHFHGLHLCISAFYAYIIQDLYCLVVVTLGPAHPGHIHNLHLNRQCVWKAYFIYTM